MESEDLRDWESYARCRSFYLFRLTALAIAVGYVDEARQVSAYWPNSISHLHWWMGKALANLPRSLLRAIHLAIGDADFVKYRQGRPAPTSAVED